MYLHMTKLDNYQKYLVTEIVLVYIYYNQIIIKYIYYTLEYCIIFRLFFSASSSSEPNILLRGAHQQQ